MIPPTSRAWVRRVGNENLWVWFRFNDDELTIITITAQPPVPLE